MTPTQTRHPWRATARTIFAALVGVLSLLPAIAVTAGVDTVPAVAQAVVIAGAITRVLANPAMDAWLRRFVP
jgi:predicted Kef-type K+ transport protein